MTNRELAQRLGVDPGHLHFHVKMLLRAGLIERAEGGSGREKPTARWRRPCALRLSSCTPVSPRICRRRCSKRSAAFAAHQQGGFRSAQVTVRCSPEKALDLLTEFVEKARDCEEPDAEPLVFTGVMHPQHAARQPW